MKEMCGVVAKAVAKKSVKGMKMDPMDADEKPSKLKKFLVGKKMSGKMK